MKELYGMDHSPEKYDWHMNSRNIETMKPCLKVAVKTDKWQRNRFIVKTKGKEIKYLAPFNGTNMVHGTDMHIPETTSNMSAG